MHIRRITPDEHGALGELTVEAYGRLDFDGAPSAAHVPYPEADPDAYTEAVEADYADVLRDVDHRAEVAEVMVAVDDDGTLLGGMTFVPPGDNPMREHTVDGAASIRMLAVSPAARRRGVARALTVAALERARELGAPEVVLHSSTMMRAAHRLYEAMGFEHDPSLDWSPAPGVHLLGYRLPL